MPKYNVQIQETATYSFEVEVFQADIEAADGDVDQAIRVAGLKAFEDSENLNYHYESTSDRGVTWFEEVKATNDDAEAHQ